MIDRFHKTFSSPFLRFFFVGGFCGVCDLALLYVLTDIVGIWYITSGVISFLLVSLLSFFLHKHLTFGDKESRMHLQYGKFLVVVGLGMLLNNGLLYFFTSVLGLWYIVSRIFSSLIAMMWNYFNNAKLVFRDVSRTS